MNILGRSYIGPLFCERKKKWELNDDLKTWMMASEWMIINYILQSINATCMIFSWMVTVIMVLSTVGDFFKVITDLYNSLKKMNFH